MKFSGLFPPVLTEKNDKTISLSSILGFEILSEKLLMLGSVDGSLFQEEIENANSGISDSLICIPSKNRKVLLGRRKTKWPRLFFLVSFPAPNPPYVPLFICNALCSHSKL